MIMLQLFWMIPVGAVILYGLFRFVTGTGPRKLQTREQDEQDIQSGLGSGQ
jgi:hypothetical protein